MEKAQSGVRAEKLVEEFTELTKSELASAKMLQWLEDNWDRMDKDFLVLLSQYIRIAEVEGQEEAATRLTAHRQIISALQSKPNGLSFPERLCLVAQALMQEGKLDPAISLYSGAIALDPELAVAYCNRGTAYTEKGQYDLAVADYTTAIALDPEQASLCTWRGVAYYRKCDYERAIADFTRAISLDPELAEAYNGRGNAFQQYQQIENRYEVAIADYSRAISLNPAFADAYANRASMYKLLGRYDEAIKDFEMVMRLSKDSQMIELAKQHVKEITKNA